MNPYLEQDRVWHDFHERFIPAVAEAIAAQADPRYVVKIDEHVFIHELPDEPRRFAGRADVTVAERPASATVRETSSAVLEAPVQVLLPSVDAERISYVEIRDRDSWRLVTVLELLSPSNKRPGSDREQYLAKRAELWSSDVHFVEIDLLRGGPRLPLEELPPCDYYVLVSRAEQRPRAGVWPIVLRDSLPVVPIPLHAPDADARLDLQAILHRVYDAARYQNYIYATPPQPPLAAQEMSWAKETAGV
jgi:hypothetical protein